MSKRERKSRHLAAASYLLIRGRRGRDRRGRRRPLPRCVPRRARRRRRGEIRPKRRDLWSEGERASRIARGQRGGAAVRRARDRAERRPARPPPSSTSAPARMAAERGGRRCGRRTLRAVDRAVRVPGCDASRRPASRRGWPSGCGTAGGSTRRSSVMDRAFDVLATEAPDSDLAALAAQLGRFTFFAGDPRSRGRADREGAADRGGTRSAGGALASHERRRG